MIYIFDVILFVLKVGRLGLKITVRVDSILLRCFQLQIDFNHVETTRVKNATVSFNSGGLK